jgi:hypothetical protein
MARVDCPHCGMLGTVTGERIIQARSVTVTTYFCDACHTEWDEREGDGSPLSIRTRPPKTRKDKQSEA